MAFCALLALTRHVAWQSIGISCTIEALPYSGAGKRWLIAALWQQTDLREYHSHGLQASQVQEQNNKEPWLAVSLSWIVPGAGHLYAGHWAQALFFLGITGVLHAVWLVSLISVCVPPVYLAVPFACSSIFLPIAASVSAFEDTRKHNAVEFEKNRSVSKDPWLAVFLSIVLPGLGHAYLRRVGFCFLYLTGFAGLYLLSWTTTWASVLYVMFIATVCTHAYALCQIHRRTVRRAMLVFLLFCGSAEIFDAFLLSSIQRRFFYIATKSSLGMSMRPTLKAGDQVIVDRFTYHWRPPDVGEVVAVRVNGMTAWGPQAFLMKRIVALGGQSVQVCDHQVYVGHEGGWSISDQSRCASGHDHPFVETQNGEVRPHFAYGVGEPYRVPEGHYFLLGDNLRYSTDSRSLGAVPRECIIGRIVKIYWPYKRMAIVR